MDDDVIELKQKAITCMIIVIIGAIITTIGVKWVKEDKEKGEEIQSWKYTVIKTSALMTIISLYLAVTTYKQSNILSM